MEFLNFCTNSEPLIFDNLDSQRKIVQSFTWNNVLPSALTIATTAKIGMQMSDAAA